MRETEIEADTENVGKREGYGKKEGGEYGRREGGHDDLTPDRDESREGANDEIREEDGDREASMMEMATTPRTGTGTKT